MPNDMRWKPIVKGLSEEELAERMAGDWLHSDTYREELFRRIKIMRELCEAADNIRNSFIYDGSENGRDFYRPRDAYRAMKEGK